MKKQPGYTILLGLSIASTLAAAITALPVAAPRANVLGYASVCSWMPWSTLLLLAVAATSCKVRSRLFKLSR
jgi:hypothetical protein